VREQAREVGSHRVVAGASGPDAYFHIDLNFNLNNGLHHAGSAPDDTAATSGYCASDGCGTRELSVRGELVTG
jgi:hypothetical protein